MIHEDSPHHPRSDGEEMDSILPVHCATTNHPKVSFVNQSRALQSVILVSISQTTSCKTAEFLVDQRNELLAGSGFPFAPSPEQLTDLAGRIRAHDTPMRRRVRKSMHYKDFAGVLPMARVRLLTAYGF
jgi:hypothetical protein